MKDNELSGPNKTPADWIASCGTERPIFQIEESGRTIKIYANGYVEGCEPQSVITNHILNSIKPEMLEVFSKRPNGSSLNLFIGDLASYAGIAN